jgi:phosphoglycerate dehydrogenase-like enzyme
MAHFIVLCVPFRSSTRLMINDRSVAAMRRDAVLINVARGAEVHIGAVGQAPRARRLGAAVLDTFDQEPLAANDPAWDVPNLFISPHMARDTIGWKRRVVSGLARNLKRCRDSSALANVVDTLRGY